ncbi:ANTAR domain-containing protein [Streptomyces sp. NPDC020707]|jgi:hypothetical protein|uniref:ANTAR domain-containing protein n=1 Tax=Streptomyces ortus TaxID=2867268 RepID=A0ABT3VE88_9ACTN|nr:MULTISPECIES: ANTAR domain-containing protein [Streptomyces]MCX4236970.1 ANTAR domain-containing protein [Streptomyces ortus]
MPSSDQRLADAFVALAQVLDHPFDPSAFLTVLAEHSAELLDIHSAGAVFAIGSPDSPCASGSDPRIAVLESEAARAQEGPGHDCRQNGNRVEAALDAPARVRWPAYTPRARELGFTRVAALPLRVRDVSFGALVLLRTTDSPPAQDTLALGQSLADAAALALLRRHELEESRILTAQLERALTSRIIIEQAKGVLTAQRKVTPDEAFILLRTYARKNRSKLHEVALAVVEARLDISTP